MYIYLGRVGLQHKNTLLPPREKASDRETDIYTLFIQDCMKGGLAGFGVQFAILGVCRVLSM